MPPNDDTVARPRGLPIMHQRWENLAFLHWPFPPEFVRPLIPRELDLEVFDGRAWIAVTPFRFAGMRPSFMPPVPGSSSGYEINVRTYVRLPGDLPAVWFFSLDTTNAFAVWGARLAFHLPYFQARMDVYTEGDTTAFRAERVHRKAPAATLDATWEVGEALPDPRPGSLEYFLVERYVLFASDGARIRRGRIHHRRWPLRRARLRNLASTMLSPLGLEPSGDPLVHALGSELRVSVWRPRLLAQRS